MLNFFKKFALEFREFAMKGSVLDLAVGVIIGGAFGKIVTALVNDIITPIIGIFVGSLNFSELSFSIGKSKFAYGDFIQVSIDFLITAFVIFLLVKGVNSLKRTARVVENKSVTPPPPTKEEELLREIRDILAKK